MNGNYVTCLKDPREGTKCREMVSGEALPYLSINRGHLGE